MGTAYRMLAHKANEAAVLKDETGNKHPRSLQLECILRKFKIKYTQMHQKPVLWLQLLSHVSCAGG
jgi:hypothetical protein